MASTMRNSYRLALCLLVITATYRIDCRQPQVPRLDDELGLGDVDVIGERLIDENNHIHDYPLQGGSTINDKPPNIYDYEPGSFGNFNYDSFEPYHHQNHRSHRPSTGTANAESQDDHVRRHVSQQQQQSGSEQAAQLAALPVADNGVVIRPLPFGVGGSTDYDGTLKGYLLSIFPLPMEFQTPFPTIGGFVGQQPPPMTPTPPITVDMTAAVAVAGVLNSNSQRAAHAETVTKPTSVPKKKKKKINTTSKRKVKPSVIIVKKIIPLSTTTVV